MTKMQGLTTGGIPTFLDARNNLDSSAIEEDNIVDQMVGHEKKVVLLGDDTWAHLFPNRWVRENSASPIEVKDLHTVDNVVLEYLLPEVRGERGGTTSPLFSFVSLTLPLASLLSALFWLLSPSRLSPLSLFSH